MTTELSPELVRLAYRLFLGREPENETVLHEALAYGNLASLRAAFLGSGEFRDLLPGELRRASPRLVPIGAPPIEVEWQADPATAALLLAHVKKTWTRLGHERPHWSVLSAQPFTPEEIGQNEAAFFASGEQDVADLLGVLRRHGVSPGALPHVFEFGCGIGRVTAHLAAAFPRVTACDVSASHLMLAREVVAREQARRGGAANVTFELVGDDMFGMVRPFDLWFSRIVLQHNPPPIIAMILRRALANLAPGGMAVFQVPTYAAGYRFRLRESLERMAGGPGTAAGDIEMHVLPQPVIFALGTASFCEPLEVLEDLSAGPSSEWCSSTIVLRKRR